MSLQMTLLETLFRPAFKPRMATVERARQRIAAPWLASVGLRLAGGAWAGGDDPTQPRLSPLNGPLAGLPPLHVFVGTHEICLPDVLELGDEARTAGTEVDVVVCAGAVHVYPLVPALEGRAAARRIVDVADRHR